jgi:cullin 1
MYLLLSRIPSGLDPLRERFEAHVKKAGLDSVERAVGGAASAEGAGDKEKEDAQAAVEPKAYVASLLAVHTKNNELVGKAFRGDQGFVASLDRVRFRLSLAISEESTDATASGGLPRVRQPQQGLLFA